MSLKFRVATRDFGQANCHSISASFARAIFHWPEAITLKSYGSEWSLAPYDMICF